MMAAALVKPTMTGCEIKLTSAPSLNNPSINWTRPTMNARAMASMTNSEEPSAASGISAEAVSRETTATGPVASWFDEPHSAATMTGSREA